jgi:large subunit ribosomal protein L22
MEARAIAKYIRMSPTKVGVILNLIRGKQVKEAFAILQYTPREAAVVINKVLKSAVANAENNFRMFRWSRINIKEIPTSCSR